MRRVAAAAQNIEQRCEERAKIAEDAMVDQQHSRIKTTFEKDAETHHSPHFPSAMPPHSLRTNMVEHAITPQRHTCCCCSCCRTRKLCRTTSR